MSDFIDNNFIEDDLPEIPDTPEYAYHLYEEVIPYSVLLKMCKERKVDIMTVYLSDVVEKYIEFIGTLDQKDYDNIANFVTVAAALLEMKSAYILPKPPEIDEFEDMFDEGERHLMYASELGMLEKASEKLRERMILNRFYNKPMYTEDDYKVVMKNFSQDKMIKSFSLLMERAEFLAAADEPKTIVKERFSVSDKVVELINKLRERRELHFFNTFDDDYNEGEIANVFLALLIIAKYQVGKITQNEPLGDVIVTHTPDTDTYQEDTFAYDKEYN